MSFPDLPDDMYLFFNPSRVVRMDNEARPPEVSVALTATDDPRKYRMTVTAPVPQLYIKQATLDERKET